MISRLRTVLLILGVLAPPIAAEAHETAPTEADLAVERLVRQVLQPDPQVRGAALSSLAERGNSDVAAGLIQAMRFVRSDPAIGRALASLTGVDHGNDWHAWMLWQQAHPEIVPFVGFDAFKADILAAVDENFRHFLWPGIAHEIRLEEITWGGVVKDGIPALINPTHIAAAEADYLTDDELVFGIEINGDARAYPLRILDWHEMANDVVGGVPLALAYCTLCGSGILFETDVAGRGQPFVFGSSGFLYRSNKLMYDHETHSLWNQFTGRPVVGRLTGSGIELPVRPVAITRWADWLAANPDTRVLSLETGYAPDYRPGRPYGVYFASPDLMFPVLVPDERLQPKDYVFALRAGADEKAWPLSAFAGGRVINDSLGERDIVLIGNAETRTVRAYEAGGRDFTAVPETTQQIEGGGEVWQVEEEALVGATGTRLARLPGHIAYWFAWSGYKGSAPFYQD